MTRFMTGDRRWLMSTVTKTLSETHRRAAEACTAAAGLVARPLVTFVARNRNGTLDFRRLCCSTDPCVTVLGRAYDMRDEHEVAAFTQDIQARVLLTYRRGFEPIKPTREALLIVDQYKKNYHSKIEEKSIIDDEEDIVRRYNTQPDTFCHDNGSYFGPGRNRMPGISQGGNVISDAGWGCMVRATQMALAQCLCLRRFGRYHRPLLARKATSEVLNLFRDSASAPLSVHNIVTVCSLLLGSNTSEWLGPTGCARAVELIMSSTVYKATYFSDVRTLTFPSGCIINDRIRKVFNERGYASCYEDDDEAMASCKSSSASSAPPENVALIMILCMRLGTTSFNHARYAEALSRCFSLPQFCGIAGGANETSADYFFGACSDGLLFLDPHVDIKPAFVRFERGETVDLLDSQQDNSPLATTGTAAAILSPKREGSSHMKEFFELSSRPPYLVPWKSINPSMALYFLLRSERDYEALLDELSIIRGDVDELFEVMEADLNYAALDNNADIIIHPSSDEEDVEK